MAKPESKPSPSTNSFEIIFLILVVTGVLAATGKWISQYHDAWITFVNKLPFILINIFSRYVVFAFFLSIILLFALIYYSIKEREIRKKIMSRVLPPEGEKKIAFEKAVFENPKWKLVEDHINSDDPNKWKLAILEADIILSEILDTLNLPGEGVGEKLKNVEASDFDNIEQAWEAHKIRNAIAHQGSDFLLTQREAKRVINLYKLVFEEFKII